MHGFFLRSLPSLWGLVASNGKIALGLFDNGASGVSYPWILGV